MLKGKMQSDLFYCNHLGVSENDEQVIKNFTIRDKKVPDYYSTSDISPSRKKMLA